MHSRFDAFRRTPVGRQLESLFEGEHRYVEFAALARAGVPSIVAVAHELETKFPDVIADTTARQFCGASVADVMRTRGHAIVQPRGRAAGRVFTYGAVFSPQPVLRDVPALAEALEQFPSRVADVVAALPASLAARRPEGTGFCLVEHVCHLRDLDAVFVRRIRAVLARELPVLKSVDGTALAERRNYRRERVSDALAGFRRSRARLSALVRGLQPDTLRRCGLRDGRRRMSVEDLVREVADHDAEHALELHELTVELRGD